MVIILVDRKTENAQGTWGPENICGKVKCLLLPHHFPVGSWSAEWLV